MDNSPFLSFDLSISYVSTFFHTVAKYSKTDESAAKNFPQRFPILVITFWAAITFCESVLRLHYFLCLAGAPHPQLPLQPPPQPAHMLQVLPQVFLLWIRVLIQNTAMMATIATTMMSANIFMHLLSMFRYDTYFCDR